MRLMVQQALEERANPGAVRGKQQCSLKGSVPECVPNCHLNKMQGQISEGKLSKEVTDVHRWRRQPDEGSISMKSL